MKKRIRLNDPDLPIAPSTARNWKHENKYQALIYNIGGTVWFDLVEWERMAEEAKKAVEVEKIKEGV